MKEILDKIREPKLNLTTKRRIINTILIFIAGIALGAFSKYMDDVSINDAIWWQRFLGKLDLGNVLSAIGIWYFIAITISVYSETPLRASLNVFVFFVGMNVTYHICTYLFLRT